MPLQVSGSDRLIEGMEKIAANRERVLSTMIVAECAARRSSRYRCQVDEHAQYIPYFKRYPDALYWFVEVANFLEAHASIQRYRREPALGDGFGRR